MDLTGSMSADDYRQNLQALLPHGPAWPRESNSVLTKLLTGLAQELARIDARSSELLSETDPRQTFEMLSEWERMAGLPDECWLPSSGSSVDYRRAALLMRLTGRGGQDAAYYIALAEALGYRSSGMVLELDFAGGPNRQWQADAIEAVPPDVMPAAAVVEFLPFTCESACADTLNTGDAGWGYTWRYDLAALRMTVMTCAASCTDSLRDWGDDVIECVIRRLRPAHTNVLFGYI